MLTQAWQETLPRETLSFDVLQLPRQPAQLLTIDEVRIHFRVWDGGQWRTLRTTTHLMQRDLYALHPAHEGKNADLHRRRRLDLHRKRNHLRRTDPHRADWTLGR
jgi:hypothetical protein